MTQSPTRQLIAAEEYFHQDDKSDDVVISESQNVNVIITPTEEPLTTGANQGVALDDTELEMQLLRLDKLQEAVIGTRYDTDVLQRSSGFFTNRSIDL